MTYRCNTKYLSSSYYLKDSNLYRLSCAGPFVMINIISRSHGGDRGAEDPRRPRERTTQCQKHKVYDQYLVIKK